MSVTNLSTDPRRRWQWLQFSLRSLLIVTVIVGILTAYVGKLIVGVNRQRAIVAKIQSLGGEVYYDYQLVRDGNAEKKRPPGPKFIYHIIGDDAFASVEAVMLDNAEIATDEDLAVLTELPQLKDVYLSGQHITDGALRHVARVPKLRGLHLTDTNVTAEGLACLRSAKQLVSLTLDGASVNDDLLSTVNTIPNLQFLQLIRTSVTSTGLGHLTTLPSLRELDIFVAQQVGDDGVPHLARMTNLEILWFFGTSISNDGLQQLREAMPNCDIRTQIGGSE